MGERLRYKNVSAISMVLSSTLLLSGCSLGSIVVDTPRLEREIKSSFISQGIEIDYVDCPSSMVGQVGDTWLCEAWDPWGFKVDVRAEITSSDGFVEWRVAY